MKKFVGICLAFVILCSFMVLNVSADETGGVYWATDDFIIDSDIGLSLYRDMYKYRISKEYNEDDASLHIHVYTQDAENKYNDMLESANGDVHVTEVTFADGVKGLKYTGEDYSKYAILNENCFYNISIYGYEDDYDTICEVFENGFRFKNVTYEDVPSGSNHYETPYFTIDTDVYLYSDVFYGVWQKNEDGDTLGSMFINVYYDYEAEREYAYLEERMGSNELTSMTISGFEAYCHKYDDGEYHHSEYYIYTGNRFYRIDVSGSSKNSVYDLSYIIENDFTLTETPPEAEDIPEVIEDKAEKNNIIIVAIVCGTVLILGVTAIIVFGRKRKNTKAD